MGQPSKPTCSSLAVPGSRVLRPSAQFYPPAMHTPFLNSPYSVLPTSPPPLGFGSPYACSPLPPVGEPSINSMDVTVGVHPYLMFSHVALIMWNVTLPCASITTADRQWLTSQALSEPATNPPRPAFTVISPRLPWSIQVSASSHAYVTLWDVLNTLHGALQLAVTPNEFNLLPSCETKRMIIAEHASRAREGSGDQGVRRVDYLMGENRFMGLSSTARTGVWALNVS